MSEGIVKVVLFGAAADRAGAREVEIPIGSTSSVRTVWDELAKTHPDLAPIGETLAFAVNSEYASLDTPVSDGDEVAVLPPVSGG